MMMNKTGSVIYNVTVKVNKDAAAAWLQWLQEEHIPDMTGTGCFTHAVVLHLPDLDDEESITYAVQYHAQNRKVYEQYLELHAPVMREKGLSRWGNRFVAFRTLMQVVH